MADVSIDATVINVASRGMRSLVWVSADVGYQFFIDSDSDFFYIKTTDGGASWSGPVEIDTDTTITCVAFDVWFDQWTPGDSGTKIWIAWFESADGDVNVRSLDTSTDTLSSQVIAFNGASAVAGIGTFCSITKSVGGNLYVTGDIDAGAEMFFVRSTDGAGHSAHARARWRPRLTERCSSRRMRPIRKTSGRYTRTTRLTL